MVASPRGDVRGGARGRGRPGGAVAAPALAQVVRTGRGARTSDRVFDQLLDAIRSLRLLPGQLLSEIELASELGVSRTPIREAIARLADAGLVDVVPQVGTRVALIKLSEVAEASFIRENLEVAAARLALTAKTDDIAGLRRLIDRQREAHEGGRHDEFFELDEALHRAIFALSGHPGAWATVQRTKVHLDRMRRLVLPDRQLIAAVIDEHAAIVDALAAGDAATVEAHVRAHAGRAMLMVPELKGEFRDYFS